MLHLTNGEPGIVHAPRQNRRCAPDDTGSGPMDVRRTGCSPGPEGRMGTVNQNGIPDAPAGITGCKAAGHSASLNGYPVRNTPIGFNYVYHGQRQIRGR